MYLITGLYQQSVKIEDASSGLLLSSDTLFCIFPATCLYCQPHIVMYRGPGACWTHIVEVVTYIPVQTKQANPWINRILEMWFFSFLDMEFVFITLWTWSRTLPFFSAHWHEWEMRCMWCNHWLISGKLSQVPIVCLQYCLTVL